MIEKGTYKDSKQSYWGCPHYGCGWMVPKDEKDKYEQHKRDAHMNDSIDDTVTEVTYNPNTLMYYYDIEGVKYAITETDHDIRSPDDTVNMFKQSLFSENMFKKLLYDAHKRGDKDSGVWEMKYDYLNDRFVVGGPCDDPNTQTGYEYECMMPNCTETMTTDSKHNMIRGDCDSCDKTTQFERVDQ